MRHPGIRAPGWIGHGPNLELVGELSADLQSNVLEISIDGEPAYTQALRNMDGTGERAFTFPCPRPGLNARLEAHSRGAPLLGGALQMPPPFALDGRVDGKGCRITGWARIGWLPTQAPKLRVEDEDGHCGTVMTGEGPLPGRRWPFKINLRTAAVRGNRIQISAQMPDGSWQPMPDSPLLLETGLRPARPEPARLPKWSRNFPHRHLPRAAVKPAKLTDVIIPVYRGREASLACINSVLATVDHNARILVVDDATDDPALAAALDALAADGRIELMRNPENQGFVASVNRALAQHTTHDAVLLNSDTLVFDDWLTRLRTAAYSGPTVGTVTPFSNSGSIASYPRTLGADVEPEAAATLHAFAASTHPGINVEIPVGVGFCLYIRRDCLRDVGILDANVFGKGYGEECDFSVRARQRGWSHRLAADVFVYHAGGLSFGTRRAALLHRSQRLLNLRHPGYDRFISSFLAQDSLHLLRRRLDERRLLAFAGRFVLFVTLLMSGGVERFVAGRCRSLRAQGLFPLMLRPAQTGNAGRVELWTDAIELPNLRYDIPKDLNALTALLGAIRLEAIEIQHFLHLDARVIEAIRALPVPYDVFVHDYIWICPRVTLIDGSGRYCGEPAVSVCESCARRNGSNLGEAISVAALRARSADWLRGARRVIAPSADTAARLQQHFGNLAVEVQPHAAPVAPSPLPRASQRKIPRVALIGAIGDHKGYRILLDCARDARARRLPIEFVVIGYTKNDARLAATGKVFITGGYSEAEAPHLLRREQPDVVWLPSVWPETWCYALDYALEAGLPVVAFDLGAIAERLRGVAGGMLLPLQLKPARINDQLLQRVGSLRLPSPSTSRSVQSQSLRQRDDANMALTQLGEIAMNKGSGERLAQKELEEAFSASVQVLPLPAGLYLFSVKAANALPAKVAGQLSLPAVHVGLGPGVRSEDVDFLAGPSTDGAWLFAQGDLLVTKVKGIGATLIMTSVRAPNGDVLSIKVERLESRADAVLAQHARRTEVGAQPTRGSDPTLATKEADAAAIRSATDNRALPLQIAAHIRTRGDMSFADVPWAGRVGAGLWIESFSVKPMEQFGAHDIEYKGLTGSGFETPWLSDEKMCGTKGMAVPLVGFAVRFKSSSAVANYDCEYSGYFQSGLTIGPVRNGVPCRSTVANDPLEGIQIRLIKRIAKAPLPDAARHTLSVKDTKKSSKRRLRARDALSRRANLLQRGSTQDRVKRAKRKSAPAVRTAQAAAFAKQPKRAKQGTSARRTVSRRATSIRRHATRRP